MSKQSNRRRRFDSLLSRAEIDLEVLNYTIFKLKRMQRISQKKLDRIADISIQINDLRIALGLKYSDVAHSFNTKYEWNGEEVVE